MGLVTSDPAEEVKALHFFFFGALHFCDSRYYEVPAVPQCTHASA